MLVVMLAMGMVAGLLAGMGVGMWLTLNLLAPKLLALVEQAAERTAALVGATLLNPGRSLEMPRIPYSPAFHDLTDLPDDESPASESG